MASLGRAPAARRDAAADEQRAAADYYRRALLEPAVRPWDEKHPLKPITLGPTWDIGRDGRWVLPELTLGWEVLGFLSVWLNPRAIGRRDRYEFTLEQARILLHWYSVEPDGRWCYRDGVLQRVKGHGKDPFIAALATNVLVGPDSVVEVDETNGVVRGEQADNPLVQLAAVSQEQTKTTMKLFPSLYTDEFRHRFGIMPPAKLGLDARGGQATLDALTSSPAKLEGFRARLALANEALALDTPIPTPFGWTTMGDLQTGDEVYAADGTPTKVTAMPVQDDRKCYRVTFGDGDSIVASDGHWWKVRVANNPRCTLHEMTTEQMAQAGREFFLPEIAPLQTGPDADLPIDPYILGLWLGDGHSQAAQIACDPQDIDEVAAEMTRLGVRKVAITGRRGMHLTLADTTRGGRAVGYKGRSVQSRLREMGLLLNKHVPAEYQRASRGQRLALLQGLMDSDGSIRPGGEARFCNTSARLLDDVRELLLGLGVRCNTPSWQHFDKPEWKSSGTLSFIAYQDTPAFRLSRKAVRMRPGSNRRLTRRIVSIVEVPSVPVRCISVEAESRLFLAGRGMHPTRNTHHWREANDGLEMDAVLRRNMRKNADARVFRTTNAYAPGEGSVAERDRDMAEAGERRRFFYDTVEAPRQAELTREHGEQVVPMVRGDSTWLTVDMFVEALEDPRDQPSTKRRFWYNQVQASEESWCDPQAWAAAGPQRGDDGELLTQTLLPGDKIVLFGDGSKSDDATGLVACRVEDGAVFTLGLWQRPKGLPKEAHAAWRVSREDVDRVVAATFESYKVIGFFFDPSDVLDDSGSSYWTPYCDAWHKRYAKKLTLHVSPKHAVVYDMRAPVRQKEFTEAAQQFVNDVERRDFEHDGDRRLSRHVTAARRSPNRYGVSLQKESRESPKKIDLAVCAVGARMMQRLVMLNLKKYAGRSGRAW